MKSKVFEMKKWDTHHHIIPDFYVEAAKKGGFDKVYGTPWAKWSPKMMFNWMDGINIERSVMSISLPGVNFGDNEESKKLCRQLNDYMAELIKEHPERLGGFASVPLPDVDGAVKELQYALDELNLDGIGLISNINGHYLGDKSYEPFFEEANKRKAIIYIHPAEPKLGAEYLMLNYTYYLKLDTAKTIMDFLRSGYHNKYPEIKFILSHGGGVLPAVCADMIDAMEKENPNIKEEFNAWRSQIFADTALITYTDETFPTTLKFFGANHIVYGSDLCWAPSKYKYYLQMFSELNVTEEMFEDMLTGNIKALFSGKRIEYKPFDIEPESAKRKKTETNYHVHCNLKNVVNEIVGITNQSAGEKDIWSDDILSVILNDDKAEKTMLSMDLPEVWDLDDTARRNVLKLHNESVIKVKGMNPDKIGVLGAIDLNDPDNSIKEIDYCLNQLQMDGLCLYVDIVGKPYDLMFDEDLLEKLEETKVPVVIHPKRSGGVPLFNKNYYDTAAYMFSLIYTDHFEHLNEMNYIPTHTSGLLDFLSHPVNTMLYIDPKTHKPRIGKIIVEMMIKKIEPVHDYIKEIKDIA